MLSLVFEAFPDHVGARPNFLGIGVQKAGTTTVAHILASHPEISFPKKEFRVFKEVHFFDYPENMKRLGIAGYFDLFEKNKAVGEFTPNYLFVPGCADRIYDVLGPDIRFIVALRNPVDRAFAHYSHAVNNWHREIYRKRNYPIETLSFEKAIEHEEERLKSGKYQIHHLSYFSGGLYAQQLKRYFQKFPRENFYIYLLEDYSQEQERILAEIYRFLEVDQGFRFPNPSLRLNRQTNQTLPQTTRSMLVGRYKASIEELEDLLGWDLSSWKDLDD